MVKLTVVLKEGRDLLAADFNGKSDPYCILKLRSGGPSKQSKVIPKTLNPKWNDTFYFDSLDPSTDALIIDCFDKDIFKDDSLGTVEIPLAYVPIVEEYQIAQIPSQRVKLQNVKKGEIDLTMYFSSGFTPREYQVHYNTIAGGLTKETGDKFTDYATYEIDMFGVATIFGNEYQHWNVNYDKANQIFGSGASAALARKAINLQHAELYREGKWRTERGRIENGEDFLRLLNYGVRDGKRRMYTYSLMDDVFRFSETSTSSTMKDFMSKHATHANAAPKVRYAGEFHIRQTSTSPPSYALIIDNNSGTYAPDKNLLPKLQQLFMLNFPGLVVEALDFKDPRLAQYKQELTQNITSPSMPQDSYYPQQQPQLQPQPPGYQPPGFAYPPPNDQYQFGPDSTVVLPPPPPNFIPSYSPPQYQPGMYSPGQIPQAPPNFIPHMPHMQYPQNTQLQQYPLYR